MKRALFLFACILAWNVSAKAADYSLKATAIPVASWEGFYMGVQGGAVWSAGSFQDLDAFSSMPIIEQVSGFGGTVGGHIGYNWQRRYLVYGFEADGSWIDGNATSSLCHPCSAGANQNMDPSWLATVRGRVGVAFDDTLLYLTGGAAFGAPKNFFDIFSNATGVVQGQFTSNSTQVGLTAGVGVEHQLSPKITMRGEFRYVDFRDDNVVVTPGTCAPTCVGDRGEFSSSLIIGLVGASFKF
jgi:outer membrane immunogenic protein